MVHFAYSSSPHNPSSTITEYSTFLLDDSTPALTLRTIGGILDFHFFLGPTPEQLNVQYVNVSLGALIFLSALPEAEHGAAISDSSKCRYQLFMNQ